MVLNALFSFGLLLTSFTQLRLLGVAGIGPGESILLLWLVLTLIQEVARLGPTLTPPLARLLIFWALFVIAECVGTLAGFVVQDRHDPMWVLHDVLAYSMMAPLSCLLLTGPGVELRLRRVAWMVSVGGSMSLALQLANAQQLLELPVVDPWFWDRLRGWSENPNQLAFLCVALGALSLHLAETSRGAQRVSAIACMPLPIVVGCLTRSDTFAFVLVVGSLTYIFLKIWKSLRVTTRVMSVRSAFAWIIIGALPLSLVAAAPLATVIEAGTMDLAKDLAKDQGKSAKEEADVRLGIWSQAIRRGIDSGLLGRGPGPHLEMPYSIVKGRAILRQRYNIVHPDPWGAPNFEAHNTLLDLFVQGGLLAVLTFVWLAGSTISTTYKNGCDALMIMLSGLLVFGLFHLIIRQPLIWFAIALCLVTKIVRVEKTSSLRNS
jgi:O-Antigen ligase